MSKKNGHFTSERWIKTKLELSRLCGVSRTTLDHLAVLPGFPQREKNGCFPLTRCLEFVHEHMSRGETTAELKQQKLREEIASLQLRTGREAGELMPLEWCEKTIAHLVIGFRRVIESSGLTVEQKETMYSGIEKIDCDKFLAELAAEWGAPGASNGETDED